MYTPTIKGVILDVTLFLEKVTSIIDTKILK